MTTSRNGGVRRDECYTPAPWVEPARAVLRVIDCDPASSLQAQTVVRARRFFTLDGRGATGANGLRRRWRGRVWLNPPYSDPAPWVDGLLERYARRETTDAIVLLNARTGAAWFDRITRHAWRCEVRRRIRFWGPSTTGTTGFNDQVYFYLGAEPERFAARFCDIGRILPPTLSVTQAVTRAGAPRACSVCGRSLAGCRADAITCAGRCRQRAYRQRLAAGL